MKHYGIAISSLCLVLACGAGCRHTPKKGDHNGGTTPVPSWKGKIVWVKEGRNETQLQLQDATGSVAKSIRSCLATHPEVGKKFRIAENPEKERAHFEIEGIIRDVGFKRNVSPDNLIGKSSTVTIVEVTVELKARIYKRPLMSKDRSVEIGPAVGDAIARRVKISLEDLDANRVQVGNAAGQIPPKYVIEAIEKAARKLSEPLADQVLKD